MPSDKQYPLSLVIKAVDKATGPLRQINARMKEMNAPFKSLGKDLKESGEQSGLLKVGSALKGVGSAAGNVARETLALGAQFVGMAAGATFGLYTIVKGAVDAGDELSEMSKRVGLGVDAYAQLRFAAEQSDISAEDFNNSMDKFNVNMGLMRANSGPIVSFLEKVGPGLLKQVRGVKTNEEALALLTTAFEEIKDPQRRAALGQELFGKTGKKFGQFLGQGADAVDALKKRFFELAGSQKEFAENSDAADNALRETETAFMGLRNAAAAQLLPAITELATAVATAFAGKRDGLKQWASEAGKAISDWIKGGGIDRVIKSLGEFATSVGKVVDFLGGFKGVAIAAGAIMAGPLLGAIVGLGSSLVSLGIAMAPLAVMLWPFIVAAAPFIAAAVGIGAAAVVIYKNWEGIKFFFKDLWGSIVWYAQQGWAKIKPVVDAVAGAMAFTPIGLALKGASFLADKALGPDARPSLGAAAAAPPLASAQTNRTEVAVKFDNLPKGTRVTQDKSGDQPVDLSLGYNMGHT